MNSINPSGLSNIDPGKIYEQKKNEMLKDAASAGESGGFQNVLKGFIDDVNELQHKADDKIEKLASGEVKDIHEVMIAATEAETSFKIMMEMRNKIMGAYKEITKL